MSDLRERCLKHLTDLAPHARDRKTAMLLREAADALAARDSVIAEKERARGAAVQLWNGCAEELKAFEDMAARLSSSLGQGGLDAENISATDWEKRISEGIAMIGRVEIQRREQAEAKLAQAIALVERMANDRSDAPDFVRRYAHWVADAFTMLRARGAGDERRGG